MYAVDNVPLLVLKAEGISSFVLYSDGASITATDKLFSINNFLERTKKFPYVFLDTCIHIIIKFDNYLTLAW